SMRRGRVYLGTVPSKKRVQRICRAISDETGRDKVWQDSKTVVDRLNRMMIGWANYFCLGPVSKAYSAVDMHAHRRLRRWLCDKHKEPRPGYKRFPEASLNSVYGLVQLPHRTANLPWAKRVSLFREPDAGKLPVRFDEREQETEPSQTGLR
ncbi:MAG TPA: group II intron maturase-specific domain-containing protein, partial [Terriglobales bacterium]|nr:group II intron maturase-specific domain-containing protein [Terriglobales bacterium]